MSPSKTGRIHSVESFGTVDGPGIRFVVFMQGCPLRCAYCHNPDTWAYNGGTEVTVGDILDEYERNKEYYKKGGLTVTGGEPFIQVEFVTELFSEAKAKGIHTCLDTSGILFQENNRGLMEKIALLLDVTDLVMLDIKHIDSQCHQKLTGRENEPVLAFARYLDRRGIPIWVRHVVIPGITDQELYLTRLGEFIGSLKNVKALDVLPYHTMGVIKYEQLGIPYPLKGVEPLKKEEAVRAKRVILKAYQRTKKQLKEENK